MIRFTTDDTEMPALDERKIGKWIRSVAAEYGFSVGNINYIFCSDERELEVNRQFLGHDYYTDVITFDYSTPTTLNGDIFISLDTVRSNAEMVSTTFDHELLRIPRNQKGYKYGTQDILALLIAMKFFMQPSRYAHLIRKVNYSLNEKLSKRLHTIPVTDIENIMGLYKGWTSLPEMGLRET